MNKPVKFVSNLILSLLLFLHLLRLTAKAQDLNELFQTVAFLHGKGIKHHQINGVDHEIWIKKENEDKPHPYKQPFSGTGFFVRKESRIYLVTAAHVAKNLKYDVKATVHGPEDKPLTYDISDLSGQEKDQPWVYHAEADVAILLIKPSKRIQAVIKVLEPNLFVADDKSFNKFRNRLLTVIGFPLNLGLSGKFSPITKSSKSASGLFRYPRYDNKVETTFFILDDPSVAGFSGAPVYALSEVSYGGVAFGTGPFACLGLVHGTLSDKTGGKFAAIVPSYFILDIIDQHEKK